MRRSVISVILVTVIVAAASIFVSPIRSFLRDFFYPFAMPTQEPSGLSESESHLQDIFFRMDRLEKENSELREILRIGAGKKYSVLAAEVIIRDPRNWRQRFIVNKGADDGVFPGAVVLSVNSKDYGHLSKFSVVGRVCSVSSHSSEVGTVMDREFSMSVVIGEEGIPAVLMGGDEPYLVYFDPLRIVKGDLKTLSSPFSLNCPPHIPVGTAMVESEAGIFHAPSRIGFSPWAEISNARFVIIMIPQK